MYNTSESYKNALHTNPIINRVSGTITMLNGTVLDVSDANILPGSLSINNRATADNQFSLGSVYVGQLNVSLMVSGAAYSFNEAKVELSYFLKLADETEEEIPLGIYYVSKATRSRKTIDLVCYDDMTLLDKDIIQSASGTAWELLSFISEECGVVLGQTEEEINALPNADVRFTADNNDIATWRDAVCGIAQMVGGFATIGRDGKLYLKHFHTSADKVLAPNERIRTSVSDYTTYFAGVQVSFKANENYYPYVEKTTRKEGIILNMGANPLVRGEDEYKHEVLKKVAAVLDSVYFTPAQVDIINDPSIELGDMLTITNVNGTTKSIGSIVTAINWNYRQKQTVKSEGIDPHAVKDNTEKALQIVTSQNESNQLLYYSYTNAKDIQIAEAWQKIVDIDVITTKQTDLMVFVSINLEALQNTEVTRAFSMVIDGTEKEVDVKTKLPVSCELKYIWKDEELSFHPIETYTDGKHVLTLAYFLNNVEENLLATFEVQMKTENGTIEIPAGNAIASIIGQGLVAKENEWDGNLDFTEYIPTIPLDIPEVVTNGFTESVGTQFFTVSRSNIYETIGNIKLSIPKVSIKNLEDFVTVAIKWQIVVFELNQYTEKDANGRIVLTADATEPQTLYSVDYGAKSAIENAIVESSDDVLYAISFDHGATWEAYNGSRWQTMTDERSGMTNTDFESIPVSDWAAKVVNDTFKVRVTLFTADSYMESCIINYLE